jgi:hypothetical protein
MDSWQPLPPLISRVCHKSQSQHTIADHPLGLNGLPCIFAASSGVCIVHCPPTSYTISKYHTACGFLLGFATSRPVLEITSSIFRCCPNLVQKCCHDAGGNSSCTPAKCLSVLVPKVSSPLVFQLPQSRIPMELNTVAITGIAA